MPEQERGEHNRVPSVWGQGGPLSHDGEAIEGQQVHPQQLVQQSYPGECLFSSSTMKEDDFFHVYIVKYVTINSMYFISIGLCVPSEKDYSM